MDTVHVVGTTVWTRPDLADRGLARKVAEGYLTGAIVWLESLRTADPGFYGRASSVFLLVISPDLADSPLVAVAGSFGWHVVAVACVPKVGGHNPRGLVANPRYAFTLGFKLRLFDPAVLALCPGVDAAGLEAGRVVLIAVDADAVVVHPRMFSGPGYQPFSAVADMAARLPRDGFAILAAYDTEPGGWGKNGYPGWRQRHPYAVPGEMLPPERSDFRGARVLPGGAVLPPKLYRKCSTEVFAARASPRFFEMLCDKATCWSDSFDAPYYFDSELFTASCAVLVLDPRHVGPRGQPRFGANFAVNYAGSKPWRSPEAPAARWWPDFVPWDRAWADAAARSPGFAAHAAAPLGPDG